MQIGGATSYPAPAATLLPARSLAPGVSPDVTPDITRAAQAPLTAAPALADEQSTSSREEADKQADTSTNSDKAKNGAGEPSPQQERAEQLQIAKLVSRDIEVRAHEQAHAATGGQYAGAPSFTYERGPDGKRYAVGGEVGIDTGTVPNDPEATLRKMEVVIRAALAPAEPSAQDRQVAAQAQIKMSEARADLAQQQSAEAKAELDARTERRAGADENPRSDNKSADAAQQDQSAAPNLDLYKQLSGLQEPAPLVDLLT